MTESVLTVPEGPEAPKRLPTIHRKFRPGIPHRFPCDLPPPERKDLPTGGCRRQEARPAPLKKPLFLSGFFLRNRDDLPRSSGKQPDLKEIIAPPGFRRRHCRKEAERPGSGANRSQRSSRTASGDQASGETTERRSACSLSGISCPRAEYPSGQRQGSFRPRMSRERRRSPN